MNQTNQNKFTKTYEFVMSLDTFTTKEGLVVNLPLTLKVLWQYMYGKYQYYSQFGSSLYENISDISKNSGVAVRSVNRNLRTLEEMGAIKITKKKLNGFIESSCYEVSDPVQFLSQTYEKKPESVRFYEEDSQEPF